METIIRAIGSGGSLTMEFAVVIPARYASERLPGKPLRDIAGKSMLQHVHEKALASGAVDVVIATDDKRILEAANAFQADCCMTSANHQSGTDRLAEVAAVRKWPDEQVIVNLQGDEPLMPAEVIGECAALLADDVADIATLASPISSAADFDNPNVVKVVTDDLGFALYFSRAGNSICTFGGHIRAGPTDGAPSITVYTLIVAPYCDRWLQRHSPPWKSVNNWSSCARSAWE